MIAFSSEQEKTDAINVTSVATRVGAVILGTGISLALTSKQNTNKISSAAISTLYIGSILTLVGGIALTVVSLTPIETTQATTSTTTQPTTQPTTQETTTKQNLELLTLTNSDTIGTDTIGTLVYTSDAFIAQYDSSGYVKWAAKMGGTGLDQALGISADNSGNVYVTGYFQDQSFNLYDASGVGTNSKTLTNTDTNGSYDGFLAQYDSFGHVQWAAQMGGIYEDQGLGTSADKSGNVYVTGFFSSDTSFNLYDASGGGVKTLTSEGSSDGFIAQYDSSGYVQWAAKMAGTLNDQGFGISTDQAGNVYVTGTFQDQSFNLYDASGVGFKTLTSEGLRDAFIAQYDSSGYVKWAAKMGGIGNDAGIGISADNGNVYVTGTFQDQSFNLYDASGVGSNSITLTSKGNSDGFIAQYDSSGRIQWAANMGGTFDDIGYGISADQSGNVYVTGYFQDPSFNLYDASGVGSNSITLISEGDTDGFIAQYDSSGRIQWAANMGGTGFDQGIGISADQLGNVYVTGSFQDQSFNLYDASGGGYKTLTSEGGFDGFIAQYDSSGHINWAANMGGTGFDQPRGISADQLGNVYVTGYFQSQSFKLYSSIIS